MKYIVSIITIGLICLFAIISGCKKNSSEFNFNTAVTATFSNATAQYVVPAEFVNTTNGNYTLSGYESSMSTNTLTLAVDTPETGSFTLVGQGTYGNSIVIVNNGSTYSSRNNLGQTAGVINLTVTGNNVKGTFSGTLYAGPSSVNKDSLVVTNGTISTTY
jgi:hypothetical protein